MNRYVVEFYYWHEGSGISHSEIFDSFDLVEGNEPTVADYIDNSDLEWNQFEDSCDLLIIELWKNDFLIERVMWDEDGIENDDLTGWGM